MTPAAGRGGNPPSRKHPIRAGRTGRRHPGGRLRTGQVVTPPRADLAGSPPPAPAAGRRPQPRARPRGATGGSRAAPGASGGSARERGARQRTRAGRRRRGGGGEVREHRGEPRRSRFQMLAGRLRAPSVSLSKCGQAARRAGLRRLFKPNFCCPGMLAIRARCGFFNPSP